MDADYEIVMATADDASEVAGLRASWDADVDVVPSVDFVADVRSWMGRESGHRLFWLARTTSKYGNSDCESVGMVNLSVFDRMPNPGRPPSRWGYLGNMFVRSSHRDAGLGARLVGAVLDYADANDLVHVMLNPTDRSKPFYDRAGFDREHDVLRRRRPADR